MSLVFASSAEDSTALLQKLAPSGNFADWSEAKVKKASEKLKSRHEALSQEINGMLGLPQTESNFDNVPVAKLVALGKRLSLYFERNLIVGEDPKIQELNLSEAVMKAIAFRSKLGRLLPIFKELRTKVLGIQTKDVEAHQLIKNPAGLLATTLYLGELEDSLTVSYKDGGIDEYIKKFDELQKLSEAELRKQGHLVRETLEEEADNLLSIFDMNSATVIPDEISEEDALNDIDSDDNSSSNWTWFSFFTSFTGLIAFIILALAIISLLTWQFFKRANTEDL